MILLMRSRRSAPAELCVTAPNGRVVVVCAVPRGYTLREVTDGSGEWFGPLLEGGVHALQWSAAQLTRRWVIGVISADHEPWAGQRRFHREYVGANVDLERRLQELAEQIESGQIAIPTPRGWTIRRKTAPDPTH